jgi:hypothetical protein
MLFTVLSFNRVFGAFVFLESDQPELLPIGYVVGDVDSIAITLKGNRSIRTEIYE